MAFDITSPGFLVNPYPVYEDLRNTCPVYWSNQLNAWVITRADLIEKILVDKRFSSAYHSEKLFESLDNETQLKVSRLHQFSKARLGMLDAPEHSRLKTALRPIFTESALARWRPLISGNVRSVMQDFEAMGRMDFVTDFAEPFVSLVLMQLLAIPEEKWPQIKKCIHHQTLFYTSNYLDPELSKKALNAEIAAEEFEALMKQIITSRGNRSEGVLLDELLSLTTSDANLKDHEIIATCLNVLTAGFRPVVSLLSLGMYALLLDTYSIQQVQQQQLTIDSLLNEVLRFTSPAQIIARTAKDTIQFDGNTIQAGDTILISLASYNRDPSRFRCPHRLYHEADTSKHAAYGLGRHYCLGAKLANLQAKEVYTQFICNLSGLGLSHDEITYLPDLGIRRLVHLYVEWQP